MDKSFLPDKLAFDAFYDEDEVLDFIGSMNEGIRKVIFDALDKSEGEEVVLYTKSSPEPELHAVILKFPQHHNDGGLILLLSRNEANIYSYFERLKEEQPEHKNFIGKLANIVHTHITEAAKAA